MKLKSLGANKTEIEFSHAGSERVRVLFSYQTPVAASILKADGTHFYRTSERYSNTTTRHIKSWLPFDDADEVSQGFLNGLVA